MLYKSTTMFIVSLLLQWIVYKYSLSNQPQGRWLPMKFNTLLIITLALTSTFSNAGLITDTNNNSFIDEATGIEWMDFGVNNVMTFREVSDELQRGGIYEGWSIASETQVMALWHELYFSTAETFYAYRFFAYTSNNPLWEDYLSIMGFNELRQDPANLMRDSLGIFLGDDSNLKIATYHEDIFLSNVEAHASLMDFYEELPPLCYDVSCGPYPNGYAQQNEERANLSYLGYSTLLVRNVSVPEPSTLTIFAMGIIGLVSRRFKKQ
ncbi:MAG: hypothetical protein ACI843_001319 [Psychrobacter glaciei]|jgi:hypothetical protein